MLCVLCVCNYILYMSLENPHGYLNHVQIPISSSSFLKTSSPLGLDGVERCRPEAPLIAMRPSLPEKRG